MRSLLALGFAAVAISACGPPADTAPTAVPSDSLVLFDFGAGGPAWSVENDGVMGGDSQGFASVEGGTLRFTGNVVTEGGGFTSVRAERAADLSAYDAVELRVRGGGRAFEIDLYDGATVGRREASRRAAFPTTDSWQTVRIAFSDIETTVHGEPADVRPFSPAALQSVGFYIIDGRDGPFRLEVDWVRAVRAGG